MSLILGLDPGSRITGYGVIRATGTQREYIASGCIRMTANAPLAERLRQILAGVSEVIDAYTPAEVAIEKVFLSKNADSALKLGQARGVAIVAASVAELPVFEYEARKIKQAIVGSGAATKSQVQHMVTTLLGLAGTPQADAADALAIALTHAQTQVGLARVAGGNRFGRGRIQP